MNYIWYYHSPLGEIILASDGDALTGLWFDGQKYFPHKLIAQSQVKELPIFTQTCRWLNTYFSGKDPQFTPRLNMDATLFRRIVWEILLAVPYGKTIAYGEIARLAAQKMGVKRMSAQAVGNAVGHNPISLIIPCHRVLGSNGNLTGYAGGLEKKQRLLEMEGGINIYNNL